MEKTKKEERGEEKERGRKLGESGCGREDKQKVDKMIAMLTRRGREKNRKEKKKDIGRKKQQYEGDTKERNKITNQGGKLKL